MRLRREMRKSCVQEFVLLLRLCHVVHYVSNISSNYVQPEQALLALESVISHGRHHSRRNYCIPACSGTQYFEQGTHAGSAPLSRDVFSDSSRCTGKPLITITLDCRSKRHPQAAFSIQAQGLLPDVSRVTIMDVHKNFCFTCVRVSFVWN